MNTYPSRLRTHGNCSSARSFRGSHSLTGVGLVLGLLLMVGCGEDEPAQTPPGPVGPYETTLDVASLPPTLTLRHGNQTLLELPPDGIQIGVVPALGADRSYDPFFLREEITWLNVASATPVDGNAESARHILELVFETGLRAVLDIAELAPGRFSLMLAPDPMPEGGGAIAFYRIRARVDPEEGFYGLGEVFDTPNHRGHERAMQLEIDGEVESLNNEAHVPIPFVIGTTGWGLFVEDRHPGLFELGSQEDDLVQATFGTGWDSQDGLRFHLYAADHPLDLTHHYYKTTGDPVLPAPWVLGNLVWRDENRDQAEVDDDLRTMRALDLPTSGYWIDRPYASGVNSFDFRPDQFPDPQGMIETAHDLGYTMSLWHTPYVSEEQVPELYREANEAGFFPSEAPMIFNNWSLPIDLSNPQAYAWWQDLIRRYTSMGIVGFKLDYGEDIVPGVDGRRLAWSFADGSDERTMHSVYKLLYHRVYAETLPPEGGFLLCRAGTYGDQVNVSVIWPGDLDATMNPPGVLAQDGDESYRATGGLPAAVVAGISLGPSGFPLFASDTGGYRHAPPDKETFTRWFQHTALTPVMQIGTNTNDVAWELGGENGFDEEMLSWYRRYTRLHIRLFPYLWTYVQRLSADGRPIQRALGLAYPELGEHPTYSYLLGDSLLVSPVVEKGARERQVPFPPGRWVNWFSGEVYDGGTGPGATQITVAAPLSELPLFLAAGGIVPMLRPSIQSLAPTRLPEQIDSYATEKGVLYPRIAPGPASSFTLFDGSVVEQALGDAALELRWKGGSAFDAGALFEVMGFATPPSSVTLNDEALSPVTDLAALEALAANQAGWAHSQAAGGMLFVRVPPGDHGVSVTR